MEYWVGGPTPAFSNISFENKMAAVGISIFSTRSSRLFYSSTALPQSLEYHFSIYYKCYTISLVKSWPQLSYLSHPSPILCSHQMSYQFPLVSWVITTDVYNFCFLPYPFFDFPMSSVSLTTSTVLSMSFCVIFIFPIVPSVSDQDSTAYVIVGCIGCKP